jgi:hypothetical protein
VARAACSLCKGWCCRNGEDNAFLDETTMASVRCARSALNVRAVLRLYVERVPEVGYEDSCIFHGKQGCTLDRSLRSDVCNRSGRQRPTPSVRRRYRRWSPLAPRLDGLRRGRPYWIAPRAASLSAFTSANIDKILALKPDLALSFSDLQAVIVAV